MMGEMSEPKITPLARRLAEENGIDWRQITGTGPDGTITEKDILNFLAKVMTGEVTLAGPPPGEPPPPEGEADLEAARAALEKEGVTLDELLPEATSEFELDLDFEEAEAEEAAGVGEASPTAQPEPETWPEETIIEASPPQEESFPSEPDITAETPVFVEEEAEPVVQTEPDITAETPVFADEVAEPEPEPEPEPEERITAEFPVYTEQSPEAEAAPAEAIGAEGLLAGMPQADAGVRAVPLWPRAVSLAALDALLADLNYEFGRNLSREAFLYLAAKRALAELEIPLRALKGRRLIAPANSFAEFLSAWAEEGEEAEGLSVAEETPPIRPEAPSLRLTTAGMPEGQGLLLLFGELDLADRFLDLVVRYLERPVRLLVFR